MKKPRFSGLFCAWWFSPSLCSPFGFLKGRLAARWLSTGRFFVLAIHPGVCAQLVELISIDFDPMSNQEKSATGFGGGTGAVPCFEWPPHAYYRHLSLIYRC